MNENKRYQLRQEDLDYPIVNFYSDLIDTANNDKVICSFELDVGTSKMVDLLNKQDKRIKELEEENASMKGRIINAMIKSNQVECNCSPCVCEDYVNEELKKW